MNRRSFLALLGFAPVATPAAVAAATAPQSKVLRWSTASGASYMRDFGRRVLVADEIDLYPSMLSQGDSMKLNDLSRLTYADVFPERVVVKGSTPVQTAVSVPLAFIDDVGSGP